MGYQSRIYRDLKQMIDLRKSDAVFGVARTEILETYRPHLFAYLREHDGGDKMLAIATLVSTLRRYPCPFVTA
ncbi:hypothetical protein JCM19233_6805 [Vibrio astriarenae]|nr:hypothetical protein JCM19233_6805 [Vibrio sp. C7]